jgi:3-oxoacyl-[acyl-carrier protein] reductase
MKLKNLVSLVTGASQGLGRAIAIEFVREGSHVPICARDSKMLWAVAAEMRKLASDEQKIFATACDVSVEPEVQHLFREIRSELGCVDVLVNNAGVYVLRAKARKCCLPNGPGRSK